MIPSTNVKFSGKEYIKYLEYKRKHSFKWNNLHKDIRYIIKISFVVSASLILLWGIKTLFYVPPVHESTPFFERMASISWDGILKFSAIVLAVSWLIHGFKVRLLA